MKVRDVSSDELICFSPRSPLAGKHPHICISVMWVSCGCPVEVFTLTLTCITWSSSAQARLLGACGGMEPTADWF